MTTSIHDVAAYILERQWPMSLDQLQAACFYANLLFLRDEGRLMFTEPFYAGADGPFCPDLDEGAGMRRWRRRHEARAGTRGRRGARRYDTPQVTDAKA